MDQWADHGRNTYTEVAHLRLAWLNRIMVYAVGQSCQPNCVQAD